jgi:MFS family permease
VTAADVERLRSLAPEFVAGMARHRRRNMTLMVLEGGTFALAMSLLSETTMIPAFIQALTGSALLVGLVGAVWALGRYLPQLVGAHLALGRRRRKPLFLTLVIAERVAILMIAIAASFAGVLTTELVVLLFFLAFAAYSTTVGLLGPVYGDFIAKAITVARGWVFGLVQLLGGILGFVAALGAERLLATFPFPLGNQLAFWLALVLSLASIVFVANLVDLDFPAVEPRPALRSTLAEVPRILRGHRDYRRYLEARAAMAAATGGVGFVVVAGLSGPLSGPDAAVLAGAVVLAQAVLGFGLGILGNRTGYRLVVVLGAGLIIIGMLTAALADSLPLFALACALLGGANALTFVCDPSMSIEFAPPGRTSVYLGTTLTLLAPFFIAAPLLAGLLVPVTGFVPVFVGCAVLAALGGVLALRFRDPRRGGALDEASPLGAEIASSPPHTAVRVPHTAEEAP